MTMKYLKRITAILLYLALSFTSTAQERAFNCYSILAGRSATADGSVFLAHNEDDWGERVVNMYKIPAQAQPEDVLLRRGGTVTVKNRMPYLWLEMPGLEFSDSYINEYGVAIASDGCPSREDQPELTDGGIGYYLRRLMAAGAHTAREAVQIGGELVERFGYASSGRTYCIAGPNEAWMLSVVRGKHWVAERIPDRHVAIIPNYYTIDEVNLQDTMNYLGSTDLIDYAVRRGWYDPSKGEKFSFRKAYGNPGNLKHPVNIARHLAILNLLSDKKYDKEDIFPFSFVPREKIDLRRLFQLLRNHYENTEFYAPDTLTGDPHHQKIMSVCSATNQYGFVAQIRKDKPKALRSLLWLAPRRPCTEPFVPLYVSTGDVPSRWHPKPVEEALAHHFEKHEFLKEYYAGHPYLLFDRRAGRIDSTYTRSIGKITKIRDKTEGKFLRKQVKFERRMEKIIRRSPEKVPGRLQKHSFGYWNEITNAY